MVRNVDTAEQPRLIAPPAQFVESALPALDHQVVQSILEKPEAVAVDLSGVQGIDSAALNWLLAVQQRMSTQNIRFYLANPCHFCMAVFTATRLDQRFKIVYPKLSAEAAHA